MPINNNQNQGHADDILCVCMCRRLIVTGSYDGCIMVWNFDSAQLNAKLYPRQDYVKTTPLIERAVEKLIYLKKLAVLVSTGADGFIRLWDMKKLKLLFELHAGHTK
jgi:WD40 repeat protein